jgi:hypothetical protein
MLGITRGRRGQKTHDMNWNQGLRRVAFIASLAAAGAVGYRALVTCERGKEGELLLLAARPEMTQFWYNDPEYPLAGQAGTKWVVVNGQVHQLPLGATNEEIAAATGISVGEVASLPNYQRVWQRRSLGFLALLGFVTFVVVFITLELLRVVGTWVIRGFRG